MEPIELTSDQARSRAEELIRETTMALEPRPTLERIDYWDVATPCDFAEDGKASRFTVSRAYWLRDVPKDQQMKLSAQIQSRWEQMGHVITSTGRAQEGHPDLLGRSRPDGFVLALAWAEGDNLYLAATSPCLPPQDTPHP